MTAVQPTAMMAGRYQRAFTLAVVFLVVSWHLAGAGGQLLHNRADYSSFAFQGAMWLVMALAAAASPANDMLAVNGAWGTAGWTGLLVLLRRRFGELACFLAAEAAATLSV